jgi:hypothetical protein
VTLNFQSIFQAERDLLRATVDLDDSPEVRVVALRDQLKMAEEFAKVAEAQLKDGVLSPADAMQAKALVLEARIELLREELKAKLGK